MSSMNLMKHLLRKIFSPSTVTSIISVAVMFSVIACVIASAPKPVLETELYDTEVTRIVAPDDIVDTYARPAIDPESTDTVSETVRSPEFAAPETTGASLPETTVPVTKAPETTAPVTTAPVTKAPETTAPVTTAPETTAPVTTAPETTPETTAPVETAPETTPPAKTPAAASDTLLADKYKVKYTIVKPEFTVTEHELQLAAAVIQLEVMGGGSAVDAFEDTTEKYDEMLSVAEVIRNRVDSERFPNTVEEVINQKIGGVAQFSPVERLEKTLEKGLVTDGALAAAREALVTGVMVKPANLCYFCATYRTEYFESTNAPALVPSGDSYVKWEGHLTTFYAGNINN